MSSRPKQLFSIRQCALTNPKSRGTFHRHLLESELSRMPIREVTTGRVEQFIQANPAAVQRILRHSDPRITTEVYGHPAPEYLRRERIHQRAIHLVH
jgi:hypothetical protein